MAGCQERRGKGGGVANIPGLLRRGCSSGLVVEERPVDVGGRIDAYD